MKAKQPPTKSTIRTLHSRRRTSGAGRVSCSLLLFCGIFLLAACAVKAAGATEEEISAAYADALMDGAFATRLLPFIHPELRSSMADDPRFKDRETWQENVVLDSDLRQFRADEMETLERWFTFPIVPTHVLMVSHACPDDDRGITRVPVYLVAVDQGYLVVFGLMKSREEREALQKVERLRFRVDPEGLWRDSWELQFEADSKYHYTLHVRETESDTVVVTILSPEKMTFAEGTKRLTFSLVPQGVNETFRRTKERNYLVSFAYHVGTSAGSRGFDLEADEIFAYAPNRELAFKSNRLTLATFTGSRDGKPVTFAVELERSY